MIKMSITITIILTATMVLAFNCFQMYFLIRKMQCLSLSKKQKFQKTSTKKFALYRAKLNVQNYRVSVIALAKLIPANFLVLISTKFINQNISKANDEIF